MRVLKAFAVPLAVLTLGLPFLLPRIGETQSPPTEAPTGFDNLTNGLVNQATHDADRQVFEQVETVATGLGPTFNGNSCAGCHSTPVTGGVSAVTELRAGHLDVNNNFIPATAFVNFGQEAIPLRSLINQNEICPAAHETLTSVDNVQALRLTLNTLGDGFVEAISEATLQSISNSQPVAMRGQRITVAAFEGGSGTGRFGWKDQHTSLLSFSADAYLNEMGISNALIPDDVTHQCDTVADPEDTNNDIFAFARFMRATKAPPRDTALAATSAAQAGATLFNQIGCNVCHVQSIVTAPAGTVMHGGSFVVPAAVGNKIIHPFGDFLLHDIGTGDGIVQNGPQSTRLKVRTAPLWGVRTHPVFMHDGASTTLRNAILRHAREAQTVTQNFNSLSSTQQQQLLTFLMSL